MIKYSETAKTFALQGKNYGYYMYVNKAGFLQNLHYGAKADVCDAGALVSAIGICSEPQGEGAMLDMGFDCMPSEYGFTGRGDYREPTAVIEQSDGSTLGRFRYVSHKIYRGCPALDGMPHMREGDETLAVLLRDDFSDAEITLNYTVCDDSDVLVKNAVIKNSGEKCMKLKKAFSFCAELPDCDYELIRLEGRWAAERTPEYTPLGRGVMRVQSLRGSSSHQMNPFIALARKEATETQGDCYGFQLVYSGSFAITAEVHSSGLTRVQGGINDFGFCWEIGAGDSFVTPQAALCYSGEGLGRMSREYADFIRTRIINPRFAFARRPIVANNWEATYFDFDKEKLCELIDTAASLGIDTFVLDDGWFGKRDSDRSSLGDWTVNTEKLSGGLAVLADRCKERGMKFGLWFEPEMVSPDSDLFRAHPDWAVQKSGIKPCEGRWQYVLDLTRPEVVEYVFKAVSKVIAENGISYVKWDMNRTLAEFYSSSLPAHRQGEFAHRFILGVYSLAERLVSAFPEVFFEGCAGGGGRFDAGMLYYFPQIWTSDDTDAYERTKIQYGTSLCYPLSAMSCHVSACPNHQTGRTTPMSTRGAVASLGATGYELDITKLSDAEKAEISAMIKEYKRIDSLVLSGDAYRLVNPFTENGFCMMTVAKDKKSAYIVGVNELFLPCNSSVKRLRLRGLDENTVYKIAETGAVMRGGTLMNVGIIPPKTGDFGSFTLHLEA